MRGLTFEIPNKYGTYLLDVLSSIHGQQYVWQTGGEEAYYIENGELGTPLFPKAQIFEGEAFYHRIAQAPQYVIFADLKAFPSEADVVDILTYTDFLNSRCEMAFLLVDCSYVTIYAKNPHMIQRLHAHATASHYENIAYITEENDDRTTLKAF